MIASAAFLAATYATGEGHAGQPAAAPGTMAQQTQQRAQPPATAQQPGGMLGEQDREFMREAAEGGLAEVELGRLAEEQAASDAVRQLGQRMVTDHSQANRELMQLAERKGVTLPREMDAEHQKTRDRLADLSGQDFDRAYLREMLEEHRDDVARFRQYAQQGTDPDVRAWASKTLPVLESHLKQITSVAQQAGVEVPKEPAASPAQPGATPPPRR